MTGSPLASSPIRAPSPIRVGLLGAGYIADWHAAAVRASPGLVLAAVCDISPEAARRLGTAMGVPWFDGLDALLAARACDAVHVLTPPATHADLALRCLGAGLHVLVEKPMGLSAAEVEAMGRAAWAGGRQVGVSHNFLGLPSYGRLKRLLAGGGLGRLVDLRVDWALPFAPLQSGPPGLWPLRERANLLWELGPHAFAFAQDLLGETAIRHVETGQDVALPGGGSRPQSWRILGRAGAVDVTLALSLAQTHDERVVTLRGSSGVARLDYGADTLVVSRPNATELVLNPALREASLAFAHLREGAVNAGRQAFSLNRRQPYALGFSGLLAGFYEGVRAGRPDPRFGPEAALAVARAIEAAVALLPPDPEPGPAPAPGPGPGPLAAPAVMPARRRPRVAVVGGTGFIGRALTRALAGRGRDVRVLSRGAHGPFADIADRVETVAVSLADEEGLRAALAGMDAVVNLARAQEASWADALDGDIATNLRIARAAGAPGGAGRLVHAGTIASYDMSRPGLVIDEDTPFGPMEGRNVYARAKAEGEARLRSACAEMGLPLALARPGIVVGPEGPLQHWGIGRWHGAGAVRLWGGGRNVLPFVLVEDVADGIVRMIDSDAASGQAFNLVGEPMLTARDYFDAIALRLGARIRVSGGSPAAMWAAGRLKAALKRRALGQGGEPAPSLADWRSRGHLARFDNARPKAMLGWRPEADREAFLRRAIDEAGLFGL